MIRRLAILVFIFICLGWFTSFQAAASSNPSQVNTLIDMLKKGDTATKAIAVRALRDLGPDAVDATPALAALLRDTDYIWLRPDIAYTLAAIGPGASQAVPALSTMLADLDYSTVGAAMYALKKIGGNPVPYLISYLRGMQPMEVIQDVIQAGEIGRHGDDAFPKLAAKYGNTGFGLRMGAEAVYAGTYPDMAYAQAALIVALEDADPGVREYVVFALGVISPEPGKVLAVIIGALDDKYPLVRASAAFTLGYIGPAASDALPKLNAMLSDKSNMDIKPFINSAIRRIKYGWS